MWTTHHEVLQEPCAALEAKVGAPGKVTGLLEKDGVSAVDLADVDLDVLRVVESRKSLFNCQRQRAGGGCVLFVCSPALLSSGEREVHGGCRKKDRQEHTHSFGR